MDTTQVLTDLERMGPWCTSPTSCRTASPGALALAPLSRCVTPSTPTTRLSAPNKWCGSPDTQVVPLSVSVAGGARAPVLVSGSNLDDDEELSECLANGEVREILGLSGSPLPVLDGATDNDPLDIQLRPRKLNALSKILVTIDAARTPLYNKIMDFIGAGPVMRGHKVYALPLDRLREALKLRRVCHELKQLVARVAVVMWGVIMHRAMHRGEWRGNCYGDHEDSRECLNTAQVLRARACVWSVGHRSCTQEVRSTQEDSIRAPEEAQVASG